MLFEVDLGRRARAFDQNRVILSGQLPVAVENDGEELFHTPLMVIGGRHLSPNAAEHYDLRAGIGRRLDEDWIHLGSGRNTAGLGLQSLRAADLQAIWGGGRVQRHVLGLEGGYPFALVGQNAADRRRQQRFTHVRCRAEDHQRPRAHSCHSFPSPIRSSRPCRGGVLGWLRVQGSKRSRWLRARARIIWHFAAAPMPN